MELRHQHRLLRRLLMCRLWGVAVANRMVVVGHGIYPWRDRKRRSRNNLQLVGVVAVAANGCNPFPRRRRSWGGRWEMRHSPGVGILGSNPRPAYSAVHAVFLCELRRIELQVAERHRPLIAIPPLPNALRAQ